MLITIFLLKLRTNIEPNDLRVNHEIFIKIIFSETVFKIAI